MRKIIYADNAATTKLSDVAFNEMRKYMIDNYGNPSQPYSFSRNSKKAIKKSREMIASCIGAKTDEVYFTSGGSESDNWAIKCFGGEKNNKVIITSCIEHHAILNACKFEKQCGATLVILPVNKLGIIDLKQLEKEINLYKGKNILVSVMLANNEIGTIEPIKKVVEICHKYGAIVHTDAVQAVGHIGIDVKEIGVDLLSASAHKFNGPKGIGFLYVKKGITFNSLIDGGSQENNKRAGTENVASIIGMACALQESISLLDKNKNKLEILEKALLNILDENSVDYIKNGDENNHLPGLINISIKNADGEMILHRLDLKGICVSTGSACDGNKTQISDVIKFIKVPDDYSRGSIRISFGRFNEYLDAITIGKAIVEILK